MVNGVDSMEYEEKQEGLGFEELFQFSSRIKVYLFYRRSCFFYFLFMDFCDREF